MCLWNVLQTIFKEKTGILVEQNEQQQQKNFIQRLNINITQKLNLTFEFH